MQQIALVAVFGAVGSVARHLVGLGAKRWLGAGYPWGTLAVNVVGAFVLGVLLTVGAGEGLIPKRLQVPLATGLLGAFTTFSTFATDTVRLAEAGRWLAASGNLAANLILGLLAAVLGMAAGRALVAG